MDVQEKVAVTGAFSYTGKYIARRLLAQGKQVITLTGHPERPNPLGTPIQTFAWNFDQPQALVASLAGVKTVYNTYWVRFNYGRTTYDQAVENTRRLIQAAQAAGVQRFVHVSISNPSPDSPLPYFRGKALLEESLRTSGMSYAIVRPTVIYSLEDILINNIAFLLRKFPIFAIPGSGEYRLQPVYVEDMADITVRAGEAQENLVLDAVGPEIFTFTELVQRIQDCVGSQARLLHLPSPVTLALSGIVGRLVGDVVLTPDELSGLSAGLLVSNQPPRGITRLSAWLEQNAHQVGTRYASELKRHYRRPAN